MILNNKRCEHEVCVLRLHRHLFAPERVSNRDEVIGYNQKTELVISAAASLQDALKEIESTYNDEHPNVTLTNNFGSSGALKQQIAQGAKADLFFSAAEAPFDELVKSGDIDQHFIKDAIQNELVLIVPKDHSSSIKSFQDVQHIKGKVALGTPESVPAGTYGKEIFTKLNIWDQVKRTLCTARMCGRF